MSNFQHVFISPIGSILPIRCQWCAKKATCLLVRISADGNEYRDIICHEHAQEWDKYQEGEQLGMEIE